MTHVPEHPKAIASPPSLRHFCDPNHCCSSPHGSALRSPHQLGFAENQMLLPCLQSGPCREVRVSEVGRVGKTESSDREGLGGEGRITLVPKGLMGWL